MTEQNNTPESPLELAQLIQQIALHGVVNSETGVVHGSERTIGYVAKIHEDGELAGTIDVQEYIEFMDEEDIESKVGYHEGVYISALQNNSGMLIRPKLYSEVVIVLDPTSQREYVSMSSQVDVIRLDSHNEVSIGVKEREEFDIENEEGDDVDQLEATGLESLTEYTKDNIKSSVKDADDNSSSFEITAKDISIEHDKAKATFDDKQVHLEMGNSSVTIEDGTVYVGSTQQTEDAVLGQQLASILSDLVGYLGQMMTPTLMGPQPPSNVLGSFIALKAKIQSFASSHSGFLTPKVQIQK